MRRVQSCSATCFSRCFDFYVLCELIDKFAVSSVSDATINDRESTDWWDNQRYRTSSRLSVSPRCAVSNLPASMREVCAERPIEFSRMAGVFRLIVVLHVVRLLDAPCNQKAWASHVLLDCRGPGLARPLRSLKDQHRAPHQAAHGKYRDQVHLPNARRRWWRRRCRSGWSARGLRS